MGTEEEKEKTKSAEYIHNQFLKCLEPFKDDEIGIIPKPYFKNSEKEWCNICNSKHGQPAKHIKFVGHAAVTKRLIEIDPQYTWKPMAQDSNGLPLYDKDGGLWIELTLLGNTKPGYGDGETIKEIIGDAIRNAAMRFGIGLEFWIDSELKDEEIATIAGGKKTVSENEKKSFKGFLSWLITLGSNHPSLTEFDKQIKKITPSIVGKRGDDNKKGFNDQYVEYWNTLIALMRDTIVMREKVETSKGPITKKCPKNGEVTELECSECNDKHESCADDKF